MVIYIIYNFKMIIDNIKIIIYDFKIIMIFHERSTYLKCIKVKFQIGLNNITT